MALNYQHQAKIETLAKKVTGTATPLRYSDMATSLFSDPGSAQKRKSDELVYYQGQNGDGATVNRKMADAGFKFWSGRDGGTETRVDQAERDFNEGGGTYP